MAKEREVRIIQRKGRYDLAGIGIFTDISKSANLYRESPDIFRNTRGETDNFRFLANEMILHMAGYRNADDGEFHNVGDYAYLASSSPKGDEDVHYAILKRGNTDANRNWNNHEHGMSLRFLSVKELFIFLWIIMISLSDIFLAYYDCRKNKRNTSSALAFELHYESECMKLYEEIRSRSYKPLSGTAFIVHDPVRREIFASDFRDRVIHHLILRKIEPFLERILIHDVYSARKGKGTHYGVKRISRFIRACSDNYTKDAHILKLDISGFFMGIHRELLLQKINSLLDRFLSEDERKLYGFLIETLIRRDITKDCTIKGKRTDWVGLPKSKSLFYSAPGTGIPIGNLTSQIFANLYLHELDTFIKKELKIRYYGRYVDDFVLVHEDKDYLGSVIPKISEFLETRLFLKLHPKKIYLQHYTKGVQFLGVYIKPHRLYIGNRTKGNFYACIKKINEALEQLKIDGKNPDKQAQDFIPSRVNSYLGMMGAYDTYRLRKKMLSSLFSSCFWEYFYISEKYRKIVRKKIVKKGL